MNWLAGKCVVPVWRSSVMRDTLITPQPRSLLELGDFLLSLDLPQDTADAWRAVL
jgi:hypothetical protein